MSPPWKFASTTRRLQAGDSKGCRVHFVTGKTLFNYNISACILYNFAGFVLFIAAISRLNRGGKRLAPRLAFDDLERKILNQHFKKIEKLLILQDYVDRLTETRP